MAGGCVFNSQELLRNHVEHARIVCIHFHATARSPARPRIFFKISNFGYAQPNPRWSADAKSEQFIFRHWPMPQCRKIKTFAFQVCPFRRENGWGWASISRLCWRFRTPSVVEHARIVCIHFHATARSPARPRIFFKISNFGYAQPNPRWSADAKSEQFIFRHWPMPQCRKIKTFAFQVCPFRRENGWGWASISRSCWRTPSVDFSNLFAVTPSSPSPPNPQDHNLCRAQPRLTVR